MNRHRGLMLTPRDRHGQAGSGQGKRRRAVPDAGKLSEQERQNMCVGAQRRASRRRRICNAVLSGARRRAGRCAPRRARPAGSQAGPQSAKGEVGARAGQARVGPPLVAAARVAAIPWLTSGEVEDSGRLRLQFGVATKRRECTRDRGGH